MENTQYNSYAQDGTLSTTDRVVRIVMGGAIVLVPFYLAVSGTTSVIGWLPILTFMAFYPLLTGMGGRDPLYAWIEKVIQRKAAANQTKALPLRVANAV